MGRGPLLVVSRTAGRFRLSRQRWTVEKVIARLRHLKRRATYGAVAKFLGVPVRRLMAGQTDSFQCSWVVAKTSQRQTGSRRGRPSGFKDADIDPDCLSQIREHPGDFISDPEELRRVLAGG